jgi:hypothetical protein
MLPQNRYFKNRTSLSRIGVMSNPTHRDDVRERFEAHLASFEPSDELKQQLMKRVVFLESEEGHEFWTSVKGALRGDATGLLGWTQRRIGHKPNPMLRVQLTDKDLGKKTPAEIWGLVDYHGGLRTVRVQAASTSERILRIRKRIRRYASLDEALRVLRDDSGETLEHVLLREIEEAVCSPELSALSDKELVRYITNDIRRRGRERRNQQEMTRGTLLYRPAGQSSFGYRVV